MAISMKMLLGGAAIAGAALLVALSSGAKDAAPTAQAPKAAQEAGQMQAPSAPEAVVLPLEERGYHIGDIVLGSPDASVEIVEYISLTCPHCASFHIDSFPQIKKDYVETGKVRVVIREAYFDQQGLWAAVVARCGGESRTYAFVDAFLRQQKQWSRQSSADAVMDEIRRIGRTGGLSNERMDACMGDREFMVTLVEHYQENAKRDELPATPYFLVNGEPVRGAISAEDLAQIIDAKL
ncbi:MAG: DsbA family protein [Neomegalonema sp.]|nr:DsbA family protein [Neomegalonema sp.]